MNNKLNINEVIRIADLSTPLALNYNEEGALFGPRLNKTNALTILMVADALRWQWESLPTRTAVSATGTIEINTLGELGDNITVYVNDPVLGTITLGSYTIDPSDTTLDNTAQHIANVLATNPYGYSISVVNNVITILAPASYGSTINDHNNLYCVITPHYNITTELGDRLITEITLENLIIE
jgi:hypothetical protein